MSLVKKIKLYQFRTFEKFQMDFSPGVNLILGENGVGKTSILEAIYLGIYGISFRPGKAETYTTFGKSDTYTQVEIDNETFVDSIELKISQNKKEFYLNKKKISLNKLKKKNDCVLFSPESLSAIKSGPEERRVLIDELLLSLSEKNYETLANFRKVLKSRNKVLRDCKREIITKADAKGILQSLNEIYVNYSVELTLERIKVLGKIKPKIQNSFNFINNTEKNVDISVDYLISGENIEDTNSEMLKNMMISRSKELETAEYALGSSLYGPHKHDVRFMYNMNDSRYFCSQGQQRALILSFKMAQVELFKDLYGTHPLLMLDDVMSELDETKRQNLLKFLEKIQGQIFITTTDFDLQNQLDHSNLSVYRLENQQNSINLKTLG